MAAVAVAGRVGVVLEQVHRAADALFTKSLLGRHEQALEDPLPRLVVHHHVVEAVALGRGVLGVRAHVEVQPRTVLQEHVAAAPPTDHAPEQVAGDFIGTQPALTAQGARDAVLVLEAVDRRGERTCGQPSGTRRHAPGKPTPHRAPPPPSPLRPIESSGRRPSRLCHPGARQRLEALADAPGGQVDRGRGRSARGEQFGDGFVVEAAEAAPTVRARRARPPRGRRW